VLTLLHAVKHNPRPVDEIESRSGGQAERSVQSRNASKVGQIWFDDFRLRPGSDGPAIPAALVPPEGHLGPFS
jgi:hypothetical protein